MKLFRDFCLTTNVIPAKAGICVFEKVNADARLRGHDGLVGFENGSNKNT
jgi:hypothetical protein